MATGAASSSRLPGYQSGPADLISRVDSLSALFPDPTHPAHAALLSSVDLTTNSASLWANSQGGITLYPQQTDDGEGSSREAGYFLVVSTTRRRIDSIVVKLAVRQSLSFPQDKGRREDDEVYALQVAYKDEDAGGVWLEKGLNAFAFVLNVPSDAPITVFDNPLATVSYYVTASAVGSAKGLFGKDLMAEEKVFAMSAPADHQDLLFNHHSMDFHDDLGPCSFDVSSSLFTVGGAVFFSLTLPSPPPTLRVYAFKAFFIQTQHITSFRDRTKTASASKKVMILERGWNGPYTNAALDQLRQSSQHNEHMLFDASSGDANGWTLEEMGQIAKDNPYPPETLDFIRPSTSPATGTCVRTSAELVVEIYFSRASTSPSAPDSRLLIAKIMQKPVFLHSCGCVPGRLSLPDYAPEPSAFVRLNVLIPCRCDESTSKMLEDEWAAVRAARARIATSASPMDDHQEDASTSSRRKVGETYPP